MSDEVPIRVSEIVTQLSPDGADAPLQELFEPVYGELRRVAQPYLGERQGHRLQATAVIHAPQAWRKRELAPGRPLESR